MTDNPTQPIGILRSGCGLWPVIFFLGAVIVLLLGFWVLSWPAPNQNRLAIGEAAKLASLDLQIRPPIELDYMSREKVLDLREEAVFLYPDLLEGEYSPAEAVFGQIEDGLPWWGLDGQFYYLNGEKSVNGPSEEARFILNPYLLVAAEWAGAWDSNVVPEAAILREGFPLHCVPYRLHWEPVNRRVLVRYRQACVSAQDFRSFDLISYNARDLNMNYIYVSYADSRNVSKNPMPETAYKIPHFLHRGGSCGIPGGCNNMSPYTPEIDGLVLGGLPARVVIWLWQENPESVAAPPDLVYEIFFE